MSHPPVSNFLKLLAAGRFVRKILVELENLHITLYYYYKCTTKVIILIHTTKLFADYYQPMAKIIGLLVRIDRNSGGTIADNHKKFSIIHCWFSIISYLCKINGRYYNGEYYFVSYEIL